MMIEWFRLENYGCVRDATLRLTPLHALVGPNDSGKSTLLQGVERALGGMGGSWTADEGGQRTRFEARVDGHDIAGAQTLQPESNAAPTPGLQALPSLQVHTVRYEPRCLRRSGSVLTEDVLFETAAAGINLPGVLDAIQRLDRSQYNAIQGRVVRLFPSVRTIRLAVSADRSIHLLATLENGREASAARLSEGLLHYLAFECLLAVAKPGVLLLEAPETGLHPARIADVVAVLRQMTETRGVQVLLATHSPLVINEMKAEEVSIVTRDVERGTRVTPMVHTRSFVSRSTVYGLGELWLSYGNGVDEVELVGGGGIRPDGGGRVVRVEV